LTQRADKRSKRKGETAGGEGGNLRSFFWRKDVLAKNERDVELCKGGKSADRKRGTAEGKEKEGPYCSFKERNSILEDVEPKSRVCDV